MAATLDGTQASGWASGSDCGVGFWEGTGGGVQVQGKAMTVRECGLFVCRRVEIPKDSTRGRRDLIFQPGT
jgi:3-deoxy-D-arabino-heptulosonate 7-phosphate (DAHP) synthase